MDYRDAYVEETEAWLRLVHTDGIGPKRAWQIYRWVRESGVALEKLIEDERRSVAIPGISAALMKRLGDQDESGIRERLEKFQDRSLQLLYPGSTIFNVPEIAGLPPLLCLWGDPDLLHSTGLTVLLKSRNAGEKAMRHFLRAASGGALGDRTWCFCPFSKIDWELAESLLKLRSGIVLGTVSGIPRRVWALANEYSSSRLAAITPEPRLRNRWSLFSCTEAFYDLFSSLAKSVFLIEMQAGGKTARRVQRASAYGCEILELEPSGETIKHHEKSKYGGKTRRAADKNSEPAEELPDEEDDRFISSL